MFKPAVTSPAASAAEQQLWRLNADFLQLLIEVAALATRGREPLRLRAEHALLLRQCNDVGIARMAGCGNALFSLSLHRADIWRQAVQRGRSAQRERLATHPEPRLPILADHIGGFRQCAVFFAWHLAQQQPQQARLLLGMTDDCIALVAALALSHLQDIALQPPLWLQPRWQDHPFFWLDLLRYGQDGEPQQLKLVQLLISQLAARELEPAVLERLNRSGSR